MHLSVSVEPSFLLCDIVVEPQTLTLQQASHHLQIQQKPMEVLCYLAKHFPALVSREQLIANVWDGNHYVGEKALTNAIWQLRQTFSQLGNPELITTVRKKGYRLQCEPQWSSSALPTAKHDTPVNNDLSQPASTAPTDLSKAAVTTGRHLSARWLQSAGWICAALLLSMLFIVQFWPAKGSGMQQISQQQGWSMYPTISMDGSLLAYSWQLFGQSADLYVQDLTQPGQKPRQLTFTTAHESQPVISPDGRYLYYSVKQSDDRSCQIRQLSLQTLQEQILKDCKNQGDIYLDVSYDNRYLYFNGKRDHEGRSLYRLDLTQQAFPIEAMPCLDNCTQRVRDVAVDPTGRFIALTRRANRLAEEIFLYDLASLREKQLTFGHSDIRGLAWTPDGQQLIFSSEHNGRSQGYLYQLENNRQTRLPFDDVSFVSRVTAQNSLFFHRDSSISQLGYVQLDKATAVFPLSAGDLSYQSPDFHHGRAELLYISNESGNNELWIADRELLQKRQMTRLGGVIKYPRWSNRGDKILFVSRSAESTDDRLTILDVATGKLEFPATGVKVHGRPTWTADDAAILMSANNVLLKFDLSAKAAKVWHKLSMSYVQMIDDKGFYFSRGQGQGIFWQALSAGEPTGEPEQIISGQLFGDTYNWIVTPDRIIYQQSERDGVAIRQMRFADRQHQTLVVLPAGQTDAAVNLAFDAQQQRLVMQYSPVPRIDIWRWQLP